MTTRERAAAILAAWSGDALGAIAHLDAEVERLREQLEDSESRLWAAEKRAS